MENSLVRVQLEVFENEINQIESWEIYLLYKSEEDKNSSQKYKNSLCYCNERKVFLKRKIKEIGDNL